MQCENWSHYGDGKPLKEILEENGIDDDFNVDINESELGSKDTEQKIVVMNATNEDFWLSIRYNAVTYAIVK